MIQAQDIIKTLPFKVYLLNGSQIETLVTIPGSGCVKAAYVQWQTRSDREAIVINLRDVTHEDVSNNSPRLLRILFHELAHATGNEERLSRIAVDLKKRPYSTPRLDIIEELIAERTVQKALAYFGIYDSLTIQQSKEYVDYQLKLIEKNNGLLSEFEALKVEVQSDTALSFMLHNWLSRSIPQKKAA